MGRFPAVAAAQTGKPPPPSIASTKNDSAQMAAMADHALSGPGNARPLLSSTRVSHPI